MFGRSQKNTPADAPIPPVDKANGPDQAKEASRQVSPSSRAESEWGRFSVPADINSRTKWLKVRPTVTLTPTLARAIIILDPLFDNHGAEVTSGKRTNFDQLRIIKEYAKKEGIENMFSEFQANYGSALEVKVNIAELGEVYWWQRTWSKLLNLGIIVNPPLPCKVLFDYYRPGNPENQKGKIKGEENPHATGHAMDISGGKDRVKELGEIVGKAEAAGKYFVKDYLLEAGPDQSAVHIDCIPV